jgi:hypothetical protein
MPTTLDTAFETVGELVCTFEANKHAYLAPDYSEAQARKDFIDKFWIALGWDVNHEQQTNPYEQEVKVERGVAMGRGQRRADYALYLGPNFHDVRFFVEAKKPSVDIATSENYFQLIRYGWNSDTPLAVLTNFERFHILDCRYKPDVEAALNRFYKKFQYTDYTDRDRFAEIYWLFSREAVASGSPEKRAKELPKPRGKAVQRGQFPGGYQSIDESFLGELDKHRGDLARTFKNRNPKLDSETLTELAQRTLDRLVFLRFLEDKGIEARRLVERFGEKGTAWEDFIAASRRLDAIYNGIVYKRHDILDGAQLRVDDAVFAGICQSLAPINSPYDFNAIPIHILGSIYERFLGKVIVASDRRAKVEEKPEVRKAGGVYYTPEYIVRYIVENTVGKLIAGRAPDQIAQMRFADIACGSGSFLLGVFDLLLNYHGHYYNDHPGKARKSDCVKHDGRLYLSLGKKREILLNNVYGVDIDAQAVEVCQLSLYLKLLQEETEASTRQYLLDFAHIAQMKKLLPDLSENIVCGNSLIGRDVESDLFGEEARKLNAMDFQDTFPHVMKRGGFDAIVGNPPWGADLKDAERRYLSANHPEVADFESSQYFLEKSASLLSRNGLLGMITPNTFALNVYAKKFRDQLLSKVNLLSVLELSDVDVFLGPSVRSLVGIFGRGQDESCRILRSPAEFNAGREIRIVCQKDLKASETWKEYLVAETPQSRLVSRLTKALLRLADFCEVRQGYIPYRTTTLTQRFGKAKAHEIVKKRLWHADKRVSSTYQRELQGADVGRYALNWSGVWVRYGVWVSTYLPLSAFSGPRVLIREITGRPPHTLMAVCTDETFVHNPSVLAVSPKADSPAPQFVAGILNSRLMSVIFAHVAPKAEKGLFPKIIITDARRLSFPQLNLSDAADKSRHDQMVRLVEQMLEANKNLQAAKTDKHKDYYERVCLSLDGQIDRLVYHLYGLTEDEIRIVEQTQ